MTDPALAQQVLSACDFPKGRVYNVITSVRACGLFCFYPISVRVLHRLAQRASGWAAACWACMRAFMRVPPYLYLGLPACRVREPRSA